MGLELAKVQKTSMGKKVALGGFVTALSIICLYLAGTLPTSRLFFYAMSSMFLLAIVVEFGIPSAIITYLSTALLAIFIVPKSPMLFAYVFFFGYYAIIKYYIEKINHLWIEWIVKLVIFNGFIGISYMILVKMFFEDIQTGFSIWITLILAEIAFVVYDYGFSIGIGYYRKRLRKLLGISNKHF